MLGQVLKIKDIQDNINEKYEKDVQRSSTLDEVPGGSSAPEETPEESSIEESSIPEESSDDEGGE